MFIELTDHLRCPEDHDEAFLVLLPTAMEGRRVVEGVLGCPICGRETAVRGGEVAFAEVGPVATGTALTPAAVAALGGIEGPGGYVAVVGAPASLADAIGELFHGVRLVLVNPPEGVAGGENSSVLRGARMPLKARSMRLVVAGAAAARGEWLDGSIAAVLPGNRIVAEGTAPERDDLEVLAEAGGVWVGKRR
ncbi:MAG: hypothetical protein R2909_06385 [Gemmatimonadales bacterium]